MPVVIVEAIVARHDPSRLERRNVVLQIPRPFGRAHARMPPALENAGELVDQPSRRLAVQAREPHDPGMGFSSHAKSGAPVAAPLLPLLGLAIAALRRSCCVPVLGPAVLTALRRVHVAYCHMHVSLCARRVNEKHG